MKSYKDIINLSNKIKKSDVVPEVKEEVVEVKSRLFKKDGRYQLFINQSLIKKFYFKQKELDYCPRFIYNYAILDNQTEPTESQLAGLYFELGCLGSSARDIKEVVLPRHKVTGKKLALQNALDDAIMRFPVVCQNSGIIINKASRTLMNKKVIPKNVQVSTTKKFEDDKVYHDNLDVYVDGTADFISPIVTETKDYKIACIDLKWTSDLTSTFGSYCWGSPQYMDHIQAILYSFLFEMPFVYMVFDKKGRHKFVPINTDTTSSDNTIAYEARLRNAELFQTIRDVINKVMTEEANGWPAKGLYDQCQICKLKCDKRTEEITV